MKKATHITYNINLTNLNTQNWKFNYPQTKCLTKIMLISNVWWPVTNLIRLLINKLSCFEYYS